MTLQAPLSMDFPKQEYLSGLPFPPPGDLPGPGIEPKSPALAGRLLTIEPLGKPLLQTGLNVRASNCSLVPRLKSNGFTFLASVFSLHMYIIYIYIFLSNVFVSVLAALGLRCCGRLSLAAGSRGCSPVAERGLLIAATSLVAEPRL